MRRAVRQTIFPLILILLGLCVQHAVAQQSAKAEPAAASKKVTVTLVRWPYT